MRPAIRVSQLPSPPPSISTQWTAIQYPGQCIQYQVDGYPVSYILDAESSIQHPIDFFPVSWIRNPISSIQNTIPSKLLSDSHNCPCLIFPSVNLTAGGVQGPLGKPCLCKSLNKKERSHRQWKIILPFRQSFLFQCNTTISWL